MAADTRQGHGWRACRTPVPGTTARPHTASRACLAHGAACCPDHSHRTRQHAPTPGTTRRHAPGAGGGAAQPRRDLARTDGDTPPATWVRLRAHAGSRTTPTTLLRQSRSHADGLARLREPTPHPYTSTAPPGGTGSPTPAAWGRVGRRAWDGLALPRCARGTGAVAWGGRTWSAFSSGHARQSRCAQQPNAPLQARRGTPPCRLPPSLRSPASLASGG